MSTNKINKGSHFCSGSGFWFLFGLLQTKAGGNKIDYTNKQAQLQGYFNKQYADLDIEIEKVDGTPSGNSGQTPPNGNAYGQGNGNGNGNGNNAEAFVFYYHPDHLGSSSYISDANGEVCQDLEYFAFGETFLEEHSNTERTPYLFNGKELDEETGLYIMERGITTLKLVCGNLRIRWRRSFLICRRMLHLIIIPRFLQTRQGWHLSRQNGGLMELLNGID